uniref:NR LBD domain-containing protein n=1 Tax=Heterorhabditis bacteriophora TaxID=37862 RepID=A0A1I7WEI2_HETBA
MEFISLFHGLCKILRHDDSEPRDVSYTGVMIYTVCNHKYLCQTSSFCHILGLPILRSSPRNTSLDSDKGASGNMKQSSWQVDLNWTQFQTNTSQHRELKLGKEEGFFLSSSETSAKNSKSGENTTEIRKFYTSPANHRLPNTNCFQTDMGPLEFRQLKLVSKHMKYLVENAGYRQTIDRIAIEGVRCTLELMWLMNVRMSLDVNHLLYLFSIPKLPNNFSFASSCTISLTIFPANVWPLRLVDLMRKKDLLWLTQFCVAQRQTSWVFIGIEQIIPM